MKRVVFLLALVFSLFPALQVSAQVTVTSGDYVDLGLPSGTLWATKNIGANSPEDYGDYFAWGETKGFKSGKRVFSWGSASLTPAYILVTPSGLCLQTPTYSVSTAN